MKWPPMPEVPTGTTYGAVEPGTGGQSGVYALALDLATGAKTGRRDVRSFPRPVLETLPERGPRVPTCVSRAGHVHADREPLQLRGQSARAAHLHPIR